MEGNKVFRVIIAGSRGFTNYEFLKDTMDRLLVNKHDCDIAIVCGEARGADTLGKKYAVERGYRVLSFQADWEKYNKSAGYIRNAEMADNADALVVFWDGKSRGTKNMIEIASKKGIPIRIQRYGDRR